MQAVNFERRVQTRALIEKMLVERREVLVLLLRVSGVQPYGSGQPATAVLHEFRQLLTDYIASAHFGLYQRIAEGTERRQPVMDIALKTYPRIAATTQVAMDFADVYDGMLEEGDMPTAQALHAELSRLGEALATRIELEDELIVAMLGEKPAPAATLTELRQSAAEGEAETPAQPAASAASRG